MTSCTHGLNVAFDSVSKRFGKVVANDSISCKIASGGIHAFLGENGAGKSTLMKILCGCYQPDFGSVVINDSPVILRSQSQARQIGIGMVYQHFTLVPSMTVLENVLLGDTRLSFTLNLTDQARKVGKKAGALGFDFDLFAPVWRLSVAERQKVEIFKLLWRDAQVLILDEPTSQLAPFEAEDILTVLNNLAKKGKTVILVSHHIEEILHFSKHITVLRKGRAVASMSTKSTSAKELARLMVDSLDLPLARGLKKQITQPLLSLKNVVVHPSHMRRAVKNVDIDLYSGEVLGIAGVTGSGQDELAAILTGQLKPDAGTFLREGKEASWQTLKNPTITAAHVPADAKIGSVAALSLVHNSLLRDIHSTSFCKGPFLSWQAIRRTAVERINRLKVQPADVDTLCGSLSGGNLQRLIIAREIDRKTPVMVAINPAAGLDIGATQRVQQELREQASYGKAVVLVSPDLQELLSTCDRVMVMCAGEVVGTESAELLDAETLGLMVGGVKADVIRLLKHVQSESNSLSDPRLIAALTGLMSSNSPWQRRLAAQVGTRVFTIHDIPALKEWLARESNDECKVWIMLTLVKLDATHDVSTVLEAFASSPVLFLEAKKRLLALEDMATLKEKIQEELAGDGSSAEMALAAGMLEYLTSQLLPGKLPVEVSPTLVSIPEAGVVSSVQTAVSTVSISQGQGANPT